MSEEESGFSRFVVIAVKIVVGLFVAGVVMVMLVFGTCLLLMR
jgi:hypothetical protein